jgi:hypothetical protein
MSSGDPHRICICSPFSNESARVLAFRAPEITRGVHGVPFERWDIGAGAHRVHSIVCGELWPSAAKCQIWEEI